MCLSKLERTITMKLLIIRHGDPDYAMDSLTETGWKEAAALVPRMEKLDVKAFYVSPLGRARDTASLTLKAMNREAEVMSWLQEFPARIRRPDADKPTIAWDWLPQDWMKEPAFFDKDQWLQAEPFRQADLESLYRTVTEGLDGVLAGHGYVREGYYYRAERPNEDTLVFFCHFGLECVLLSHLLNVSPMILWHGTCAAPASVTTLTTEERRRGIACFRMNAFGDTSHLYAAGMEPSFSARFCETYDTPNQRRD